jgi:hypothetical protein
MSHQSPLLRRALWPRGVRDRRRRGCEPANKTRAFQNARSNPGRVPVAPAFEPINFGKCLRGVGRFTRARDGNPLKSSSLLLPATDMETPRPHRRGSFLALVGDAARSSGRYATAPTIHNDLLTAEAHHGHPGAPSTWWPAAKGTGGMACSEGLSRSRGDSGDVSPDREGSGAGGSVLGGGDVIAAAMKEIVDRVMCGQEPLRLSR